MDRDNLIYLSAIVDNCSKITLKKDKRTGSVYPYIRIKIKDYRLREEIKRLFGGSIIKDYYILSYRKSVRFLDIIKEYLVVQREKVDLILKLYNHGFSGKYKRKYKEDIYREFERLENGSGKRV